MKRLFIIPFTALFVVACQQTELETEETTVAAEATEADNERLVRRWVDAWQLDVEAAEAEFAEIAAADLTFTSPTIQTQGMDEWMGHVGAVKAAFPDIDFIVEELFVSRDKVAIRWRGQGTHEGDFLGIPGTGQPIDVGGTGIVYIVDGKIQTWIEHWDALGLMQQVGAISMPGES
jgi:steroid delta-isomerase-like uncharacterized protein